MTADFTGFGGAWPCIQVLRRIEGPLAFHHVDDAVLQAIQKGLPAPDGLLVPLHWWADLVKSLWRRDTEEPLSVRNTMITLYGHGGPLIAVPSKDIRKGRAYLTKHDYGIVGVILGKEEA